MKLISSPLSMPLSVKSITIKLLERYSQEELAGLLNVSERSIYNYMHGVDPRRSTLRKMQELLEQAGEESVDSVKEPEPPPPALPQPASNSERIETALMVIESYVKVLHHHLLKMRAASEGLDLTELQKESNKLLGESLRQIRAVSNLLKKDS